MIKVIYSSSPYSLKEISAILNLTNIFFFPLCKYHLFFIVFFLWSVCEPDGRRNIKPCPHYTLAYIFFFPPSVNSRQLLSTGSSPPRANTNTDTTTCTSTTVTSHAETYLAVLNKNHIFFVFLALPY